MQYQQAVILVTGHICAGKSTLFKELSKQLNTSLYHCDIAAIHKKYCDAYSYIPEWNNLEKRVMYLVQDIYTALFNKRTVYVELLGDELWFANLKNKLLNLWLPCIQIELQRQNLQTAIDCLKIRCNDPGLFPDQEDAIHCYDVENLYIHEVFGIHQNSDAKLFLTSNSDLGGAKEYVLERIKINESRKYLHLRQPKQQN